MKGIVVCVGLGVFVGLAFVFADREMFKHQTVTHTEYKNKSVKAIDPCVPQERVVKEEVIVPLPFLIHLQAEPVTLVKTVYVDRPVLVEVEKIVYVPVYCRRR